MRRYKKNQFLNKFLATIIFSVIFFPLSPFLSQAQYLEQSPLSLEEDLLYASDEVIVKFKDSSLGLGKIESFGKMNASAMVIREEAIENIASSLAIDENLEIKDTITNYNIVLYKTIKGESIDELIVRLKQNPDVEFVEPNYQYVPAVIETNDTNKDLLWGLDNIGQLIGSTAGLPDADVDAPEAWAINEGTNATVVVADVDNGIGYGHLDLINNMWDGTNCVDQNGDFLGGCIYGYNFAYGNKDPFPSGSGYNGNAHGTHIAGTISATKNNGRGVVGLAPNAKLMALKTDYSYYYAILAYDFATQNGAKIINASYIGGGSTLEKEAIKRFEDSGGLFIAAAANYSGNNDINPYMPASYNLDGIISVAATGQSDALAGFSNWGPTSVDVAAPGVSIYSTVCSNSYCPNGNSYGYMSGTSMATPHVVGLAALIWGTNPNLTNIGVKNIIMSTGDSLPSLAGKILSGKRINAQNALAALDSLDSYIPNGGYDVDGIIPASQINYSSSTGEIVVNFKVKDTYPNLTEQLSDFSYSTDNGVTWQTPINGDDSVAFSSSWNKNSYVSQTDYSGLVNSFTFNSKNPEALGLTDAYSPNTKIRFKVNDGINTSDYVVSEAFLLNNFTHNLNITNPTNPVLINSDTYNIIGSTNAGSLVEIYRDEAVVGSLQLEPTETNFSISINLNQESANIFTVKVTEPVHNIEKTFILPTIAERNDLSINITLLNIDGISTSPFRLKNITPTVVVSGEAGMFCRFDTNDVSYLSMNVLNTCTTTGTDASCVLPDQGANGTKNIHISCIDPSGNETNASDNVSLSFILDTIAPVISLSSVDGLTNSPFVTQSSTPAIYILGENSMSCRYDEVDTSYSLMSTENNCVTNGSSATCSPHNQLPNVLSNIFISCIDQAGNETNASNNVDVSFTYIPLFIPSLSTISSSSVAENSATLNGSISDTGGVNATIRGFNYGTTTNYGSSKTENGSFGVGNYSLNLTSLICGTTYHFRSYATNSAGTGYGNDQTFTTTACNLRPVANSVSITGTAYSGNTLTGSYVYFDQESNLEGNSIYRWYRDNVAISNSNSISYTSTTDDIDKVIKFQVTPIAQSGTTTGVAVQSEGLLIKKKSSGGGGGGGGGGNTETTPVVQPIVSTILPEVVTPVENKNNCKPGDIFDSTTGLKCPTSNEIPQGCTPYTLFSPLTGIKCPIISTNTTPITTNTLFTRTLKQGMQGNDVKELQIYLNTHGYPIALYNLGSLGKETTSFGSLTKKAVIKFQIANGLVGDGVVGKMTREKMK